MTETIRRAVLVGADGTTLTFVAATETSSVGAVQGVECVLTDLIGWYGGVDVKASTEQRLLHGGFETRGYRGSRVLTLAALVDTDSRARRDYVERLLSGALWSGEFGTLTVTTQDGLELTANVRLEGEPSISDFTDTAFTISLPLVAPDPFLYGEARETPVRSIDANYGLQFDLGAAGYRNALTFGSGVVMQDSLVNFGNADAWPMFVVVGDFGGGFRVAVEGNEVVYPWPTATRAPVVVDMRGTITVAGDVATHRATVRQWARIGPSGAVYPTFEPLAGGSGYCNAITQDTYI